MDYRYKGRLYQSINAMEKIQDKPTISIIIPALNEEKNIQATAEEVIAAIGDGFSSYEILIFDDGSKDHTGAIVDELASKNKNIRVIHNANTLGLGRNYKRGVELAKNEYIIMIPGDNQFLKKSIKRLFLSLGEVDIIVPYTLNYRIRPFHRQVISRAFTLLINLLFELKLRYYNGIVIHKKGIIKSVPISSNGFAYQAEILVRLIRSGHSYKEVGVDILERTHGKSSAFRPKNIYNVLKTISKLFIDTRINNKI